MRAPCLRRLRFFEAFFDTSLSGTVIARTASQIDGWIVGAIKYMLAVIKQINWISLRERYGAGNLIAAHSQATELFSR